MGEMLAYCVVMMIYSLMGGLFISFACNEFIERKWFMFGTHVMLALAMIVGLVQFSWFS